MRFSGRHCYYMPLCSVTSCVVTWFSALGGKRTLISSRDVPCPWLQAMTYFHASGGFFRNEHLDQWSSTFSCPRWYMLLESCVWCMMYDHLMLLQSAQLGSCFHCFSHTAGHFLRRSLLHTQLRRAMLLGHGTRFWVATSPAYRIDDLAEQVPGTGIMMVNQWELTFWQTSKLCSPLQQVVHHWL